MLLENLLTPFKLVNGRIGKAVDVVVDSDSDVFDLDDLCHKGKNNEQPKQAVLWLVGEVDEHTLNDSTPYDSWSMTIRLSSASDNALTTLLLTLTRLITPHQTSIPLQK